MGHCVNANLDVSYDDNLGLERQMKENSGSSQYESLCNKMELSAEFVQYQLIKAANESFKIYEKTFSNDSKRRSKFEL
jgi:hypothetical protein